MPVDKLETAASALNIALELWRAWSKSKGLSSEEIDQVEAASVSDSAKRLAESTEMGRGSTE